MLRSNSASEVTTLWRDTNSDSQQDVFTPFPSYSGDMVYGQQYAEIWMSHDVIWQDTDKGASTSLDHHCGTLCR